MVVAKRTRSSGIVVMLLQYWEGLNSGHHLLLIIYEIEQEEWYVNSLFSPADRGVIACKQPSQPFHFQSQYLPYVCKSKASIQSSFACVHIIADT